MQKLPFAFLKELLDYEWIELEPETASDESIPHSNEDIFTKHIKISSKLRLLAYRFPVHKITQDFLPTSPLKMPCYLMAYRNKDWQVKFIELDIFSALLIEILINKQ